MDVKRVERPAAAMENGSAFETAGAADVEPLEARRLFAIGLALETLVNASKFPANQSETAVAFDRTNNNRIFISSNHGAFREPDQGPNDPISEQGIFISNSLDGGATWNPRLLAAGNDEFPTACCDPSAAYDDFGNLFFVYLSMDPLSQRTSVVVLLSADGGNTFTQVSEIFGDQPSEPISVDRCEVATGAGPTPETRSVWVSYVDFSSTAFTESAAGALVTGLGQVGAFTRHQLPQGGPGTGATLPHNLGHVSIGPQGQVSVTHQEVGRNPRDRIFVNTDPDGLGPLPFGDSVFVDATQLTFFEPLPGQPERGVASVPTLAYDRSGGAHNGRLYIAYAQEVTEDRIGSDGLPIASSSDANILLRFSDDNGATWSPAIRVNDDPLNDPNAQFFQRVAVDQTTGYVGVGWLDSRDDVGGGDTDDEIGYYATVGQAVGNGVDFAPNLRLNVGLSNARFTGNFGNDYGDYTALDFHNNQLWASWPDNSNSTRDNPSGTLRAFDIYAARVRVTPDTTTTPPFVTPSSPLSPTVTRPVSLVRKGRFYQLRMTYSDPSGINIATVGDNDILVTSPVNNFSQNMQLIRAKAIPRRNAVQATYRLTPPGGTWDHLENGVYTVLLQANAITATNGTTTQAGTITNFLVQVRPPRTAGQPRLLDPVASALRDSVFGQLQIKRDEHGVLGLIDA